MKAWEVPSPDYIYIHANPTVGDYAVHLQPDSGNEYRWEVMKVTEAYSTIRYNFRYTDPKLQQFNNDIWFYRKVNQHGKVLDAWAENSKGERFETPVAAPEQMGSLQNKQTIKSFEPVTIEANGKQLSANSAHIFTWRLTQAGIFKTEARIVEFFSDKVPFGLIRKEVYSRHETGAIVQSLELTSELGEAQLTNNYSNVQDKLQKKKTKYDTIIILKEYGFTP